MSRHVARRRFGAGWFGRGRTRALLCLGVVAVLGATGTVAYWTDTGTITSGTVATGTLDLTAGPSTGSEGLGGTGPNNYAHTALALSNMAPGESLAKNLVLRNSGSAALKFNLRIRTTSNDLSGTNGLQVQVYDGATAGTVTGSVAEGNRNQPCNGGTLVQTISASVTASGNVFVTDPRLPTTGATRNLCLRVSLPTGAPNSFQGKSTKVVLVPDARQVAAP